jgi:hypothetical protein
MSAWPCEKCSLFIRPAGDPRIWWTVVLASAAEGDADVHETQYQASSLGVRLRQDASRSVRRAEDVPAPRRGSEWLLQMASAPGIESRAGRQPAASTNPCVVHRESRDLRRPARLPRLREAGETCSKHRVARLMRESSLRALHGYRIRRWSVGKPSVLTPNLLQRRFTVTAPT